MDDGHGRQQRTMTMAEAHSASESLSLNAVNQTAINRTELFAACAARGEEGCRHQSPSITFCEQTACEYDGSTRWQAVNYDRRNLRQSSLLFFAGSEPLPGKDQLRTRQVSSVLLCGLSSSPRLQFQVGGASTAPKVSIKPINIDCWVLQQDFSAVSRTIRPSDGRRSTSHHGVPPLLLICVALLSPSNQVCLGQAISCLG